jgi:hypothetical protein
MTTETSSRSMNRVESACFAAGMMAAGGFVSMDENPIYAILVGPPLAGAGLMALALLVGYFWVAVKVTRKVLAA